MAKIYLSEEVKKTIVGMLPMIPKNRRRTYLLARILIYLISAATFYILFHY
ncbi:MAG: hypothetical protein IKV28_05390 [Bacteroidales bacterium]|nr:hypothetical protein [Bacteroidales bacterium]